MFNIFTELKKTKSRLDLSYTFIFISLGTFFGFFIEGFYLTSPRTTALWFIAKIISFTCCYLLWLLISAVVNRPTRRILPLWLIMFIGGLGGVIQAFTLNSSLWLFELETPVPLFARASGTFVFAAIWLPVQCITVGNFKRYKRNLQEVNLELAQLDEINTARQRLVKLEKSLVEKEILEMVTDTKIALNRVFEQSLALSTTRQLPEITRGFANNQLRNLVRNISELHSKSDEKQSFIKDLLSFLSSLYKALLISIKSEPLNPTWFVGTVLPTIALPLSRLPDHERGIKTFFAVAISIVVIQSIAFNIHSRLRKFQIQIALLTTAISCIIPIILINLIPGTVLSPRRDTAFAMCICLITIFGYISQAGLIQKATLLTTQKAALSKIKIQSSSLNLEVARVTKLWAQHIHGTLQARLQASVLMLEIAQENDDPIAITRSIDSIREVIADLGNQVVTTTASSLSSEVLTRSQLWEGIVEITVSIPPALQSLNDPCVSDISECVGEAITNSVRHGSATKIDIDILQSGPNIHVLVTDNGTGLKSKRIGYGSKVFDAATAKRWSIEADPVSNVTKLNLTFSPVSSVTNWN